MMLSPAFLMAKPLCAPPPFPYLPTHASSWNGCSNQAMAISVNGSNDVRGERVQVPALALPAAVLASRRCNTPPRINHIHLTPICPNMPARPLSTLCAR